MARITHDHIVSAYYSATPSADEYADEELREIIRSHLLRMTAPLLREIRNQELAYSAASERRATQAEEELERLTGCADLEVEDVDDPRNLFTGDDAD